MRILIVLCFSLLLVPATLAQAGENKSDLRVKVDSIIQYQIGYVIDSTTNVIPRYEWDSTQHRGMFPSFSSFSPNPMTLIIMNGKLMEIDALNTYSLSEVAKISIHSKHDTTAIALYGIRAINGVIHIELKE